MGGGSRPRLGVPTVRSMGGPTNVFEGLRGDMVLGMPEGRLRGEHVNEELRG